MLTAVRNALSLLDRRERSKWLLLIPMGLINGTLEALSGAAVFALVSLVGSAGSVGQSEPVVPGPLRALLPEDSGSDVVRTLAVALVAFYVVKNGLLLLEASLQYRRANQAAATVGVRLLDDYMSLPYEAQSAMNSAEVVRTITTSTDLAYRSLMLSFVGLGSECLIVLGLLTVLFVTAPGPTAVVGFILASTVLALNRLLRRRFLAWGAEGQELTKRGLQALQEGVGAGKEVRVLGRESYFVDRFASERLALARVFWRIGAWSSVPRLVVELLFVGVLALLIVTALRTPGEARGELLGLLGLYAYTGFRLLPSVSRVLSYLNVIRQATNAVDILMKQVSLHGWDPPAGGMPEGGDDTRLTSRLAFEDVGYTYPGSARPALRGVSIVIERGQRVGLAGPSGAGKTTVVDVALGLVKPSRGRFLIDGKDAAALGRVWQRRVGYVPQSPYLTDDTLRRNVAFGVPDDAINDDAVWRAVRMAQLESTVELLDAGLDTRVGERGTRLSGGQLQRVSIARALYHDPDFLILDEATSALDSSTESEVAKAMERLAPSKTMLIVAHRLETLRRCDVVYLMDGGGIVDQGTLEELRGRHAALNIA